MKILKKCLCLLLTGIIIASVVCGCSQKRDYGEEYNYETDCQYSYYNSVAFWKKVQSDGDGQYILKNRYIYYYNTEKKTMTPLCNKANCLHDMETDEDRLDDCNAYAPTDNSGALKFIQYYEGYIYYVASDIFNNTDSLYRVSKDGSKKDKIFTPKEQLMIIDWLIHRGNLYYVLQTYQIGTGDNAYSKQFLKSVELSSNINDENAKIIEESDDEHTVIDISRIKAYKNYLYYDMTYADEKDFRINSDYESGSRKLHSAVYIYNIETEQNNEIPVPEGYSDTTNISGVVFLKDKMLIRLYDTGIGQGFDYEYKLPIYSINYDLTDEKIWLDNVEQGKYVQTYDDYVIISDAQLHYEVTVENGLYTETLKDEKPCINVEIYSSDSKRVSYFVYPMNVSSNFNGFGPDGVNVEFDEDENSWSVYELNFKDVLDCRGEEVKLDLVSTRRFGTLNKDWYV